ncbi:hypothetical protein [Synoicihabitans lomoniglobus]|uniref:Uncharacterized protein n=1 Tax=Synoicihabitans lomoniglobus TaxID=2909285 RepID=A0AAE9ZY13_9BACT|nr:hypothetical protein [Opitutaceae bacterium LMO-M01]WED65080.1 hypothetical protein PXH66_22305 [Opitutaceae bacterium LMO-M01]
MTPQLTQSIGALYDAFELVPKPESIAACPCCLSDEEIAILLTKPLRDISEGELCTYASKALLTVGEESDFRYYLPRILEVLVSEPGWWPDPEVVGRALLNAGWTGWSSTEKQAVSGVFETMVVESLVDPEGSDLDSWLCAVARCGMDLPLFLRRVASSDEAVLALYTQNAGAIMQGKLANEFWEDVPVEAKLMLEWFYSTEVRLLILESYGVELNPPIAPQP